MENEAVAPRIGILVVAYNAEQHLSKTLDRIPEDFFDLVTEVFVCDDASQDDTYGVGLAYQERSGHRPIKVVKHPINLGYGGNQKYGYRWAIDEGLDIVVMLHADGQYAPECLAEMVAPIATGEADAVFGSRMMESGAAIEGGMPRYKYLGNRILSTWQNTMAGIGLTEWHSGYRAYSVRALEALPFQENSDGFDFDTEIIVQLIESGARIAEIPIPTYYGDEICHVNGIEYAWDVSKLVGRYRLHKMGFGSGELAFSSEPYELKPGPGSSHGRLLSWLANREPSKVLDLGCADGALGARIRALGHHVTGVDVDRFDGVEDRLDSFIQADLEHGIPDSVGSGYDIVLCADVIEHVRDPRTLLHDAGQLVSAGGSVIASVPNFGHWYPRTRTALGLFDYDRRGILDSTHIRFFTRRSFEHLIDDAGLVVLRRDATGLPFDVAKRGSGEDGESAKVGVLGTVDKLSVKLRPQLFGYQFLYELKPG
ncbi:MAG TPA: bifunctional glycosyltransferase/class I SAM-dependent methyltransferase [Ilumatobacteraceae bacterium]|nr:bifunctional glycosyltransferase/class I SAM-dependent methyltransferase [Ilumatobacteraceae bacterium]